MAWSRVDSRLGGMRRYGGSKPWHCGSNRSNGITNFFIIRNNTEAASQKISGRKAFFITWTLVRPIIAGRAGILHYWSSRHACASARAGAAQAAASDEQRVHSRGLLLLLIIYERDLAIRVCIYSFTIHS